MFSFSIQAREKNARTGTIKINEDLFVSTPLFMPVGTQATVKAITPRMLEELNIRAFRFRLGKVDARPTLAVGLNGIEEREVLSCDSGEGPTLQLRLLYLAVS